MVMIKKIIFIYTIATCVGCKHDQEVKSSPKEREHLQAGVNGLNVTYIDYEPDIDINSTTYSVDSSTKDGSRWLDLNTDGMNDVYLEVSFDSVHKTNTIKIRPLSEEKNKISISSYGIQCNKGNLSCSCRVCSGKVAAYQFKDRIDNDTTSWSPIEMYQVGVDRPINQDYIYRYYDSSYTAPWQDAPNQYLGFKFIQNSDTLYGWLRISELGKSHIVVHDCAYQNR